MGNDIKTVTQLRPTVVIGLGGTGYEVLVRLKKRLKESFDGDVPPCISLLSIDVTPPRTPDVDGERLENDEVMIIQVPDPTDLVNDNNPHISAWWDKNTPMQAVIHGAAQYRPRGRLALFVEYPSIRTAISDVLDEVSNDSTQSKMDSQGFQQSQITGKEVYLVSSLAGGTGSGMLLDVAFTVRSLSDYTLTTTGVLVLPRVFSKDISVQQIPNSYAALKEIEFFMRVKPNGGYSIDYGSKKVNINREPFDWIYLIDSINERKIPVRLPKDNLFSLIADGLHAQIGSQIGTNRDQSLDNVRQRLGHSTRVRARSICYCSFGLASLTLDPDQLTNEFNRMKKNAAIKLINNLLGEESSAVTTVTTQSDPTEDLAALPPLHDKLKESLDKAISQSSEDLQDYLNMLGLTHDRNKITGEVRARYEKQKDVVKYDAKERTALIQREELDPWKDRIRSRWEEGVIGGIGLNKMAEMVERAILEMKDLQDTWGQALQSSRDSLKTAEGRSEEIVERIASKTRWLSYWFGGGRMSLSKLYSEIQKTFKEWAGSHEKIKRYEIAVKIIEDIKNEFETIKHDNGWLCNALQNVRQKLENMPDQDSVSPESSRPFEIVLPVDKGLLETFRRDIPLSDFVKERGSLRFLAHKTLEEIEKTLTDFIEKKYPSEPDQTLEKILESKSNQEVTRLIHKLSNWAHPLWSHRIGKVPLPPPTAEDSYLGVYDKNTSRLNTLGKSLLLGKSEPVLVSLRNPNRLLLFKIRAGLPLFALEEMEEMEDLYEKSADEAAYHADRRWRSFPSIIPLMGKSLALNDRTPNLLLFAIATVPFFKLIERDKGSNQFEIKLPDIQSNQPIGNNYQQALKTFNELPDLRRPMAEAIKQKIVDAPNNDAVRISVRDQIEVFRNDLRRMAEGNSLRFEAAGVIESLILALEEFNDRLDDFIDKCRNDNV